MTPDRLDDEQLEAAGRPTIADQVRRARSGEVEAFGRLPSDHGAGRAGGLRHGPARVDRRHPPRPRGARWHRRADQRNGPPGRRGPGAGLRRRRHRLTAARGTGGAPAPHLRRRSRHPSRAVRSRLHVSRPRRPGRRRRDQGPDRGARHPTGVARRLDLARPRRPSPGDRRRRSRDASSTATTRPIAVGAMPASTSGSSRSGRPCPASDDRWPPTCGGTGSRARRSSRRSWPSSTRPRCGWATSATRARTAPTA